MFERPSERVPVFNIFKLRKLFQEIQENSIVSEYIYIFNGSATESMMQTEFGRKSQTFPRHLQTPIHNQEHEHGGIGVEHPPFAFSNQSLLQVSQRPILFIYISSQASRSNPWSKIYHPNHHTIKSPKIKSINQNQKMKQLKGD